jgi:hypothetical protein
MILRLFFLDDRIIVVDELPGKKNILAVISVAQNREESATFVSLEIQCCHFTVMMRTCPELARSIFTSKKHETTLKIKQKPHVPTYVSLSL